MKIKVLGGGFGSLPMKSFRLDGYEFAYDPACEDYDWLVVFDEMPMPCERLRCPRERTILCTWEPTSIKAYSRAYTRQFGHLLTNRPPEAERHPHYHLGRGYFLWFVHDIPKVGACPVKTKLLSAVCSSKQMRHTRHRDRFRLVSELAKAIPGMDWFGRGVRPLARKEDALLPYKYHLAVENHIGVHHWSEKFADAILCECLPFYAGDPALAEVFPAESFVQIPIDDSAEARRIILETMARDEYSRRREAILEAKRRLLSKYNFWSQVIEVVRQAPAGPDGLPADGRAVVYARKELRKHSPLVALEDAADHVRRFVASCFGGSGTRQ